ncbi:hypothetical protein B296_00046032 [Ensete ventricosum]|uniref:WEB family protein n=1 Tax=Ensete ventricosum TaxID=4639 RepID=A0A426XM55_ENSVE|nr:hypothetical protein B296_00046032 [Ensete ventricosum]
MLTDIGRKSGMETKAGQNGTDSKAEIDTRAPFKSVKAAVSLFGEVAFTSDRSTVRKPKPLPTEETQLHQAKKELTKYREQLDNAAKTRTHTLVELERVRRTFEELTNKLNAVNESKELALKETGIAKAQTKNLEDVSSVENNGHDGGWEQEFNNARDQYAIVVVELNAAKQELRRIRKDFEASTEAKLTAICQEAKAKQLLDAYNEKVAQLSMEIKTSQESLTDVKLVTEQAQQEESKIRSEKDSSKQTCKQALEETERKMASLKEESDPQVHRNLEAKLAETALEIGAVEKEMEDVRASDLELFTAVGAELDGAKGMLQKLAEEESSFRSLVDSLKLELGAVKNERAELKEKDAETGYVVNNLNLKIQKCKAELEAAMAADSKATSASDDLVSAPQQLSRAEKNKSGEELRDEAEKKLQGAPTDADVAVASEANITISKEEYESLTCKLEECETLMENKVAAAMAQVEVVRASENEVSKKLEAALKEMEEIEAATKVALKRSEMAEAAKNAVEGELRRWRDKEQQRAAEPQKSAGALPPRPTVHYVKPGDKSEEHRKVLKAMASRKTFLSNLSGLLHRKKSNVDGGGSPSHPPGEKPL